MDNVSMKVVKDKLVVTIDLTKNHGPSNSGKTIGIASTRGNKEIEGHEGVFIGVNVYKYAEKRTD